jgi:hypothetical protein
MATTPKRLTELPGEQLENLLGLIRGSNSVELKVTLPESEQRSAVRALGLDLMEAQIRQVFFFDTPGLTLNQAGVVVRARRIQGRQGDSVVKLRPVVPDELPDDIRRSPKVNVEVDAMPGGYVCSATMRARFPNDEVLDAVHGVRPLRKIFTKEQRSFLAAHAPEGLAPDDLSLLGPVFVLKLVTFPKGFGRRLVVELWLLPDGSRILELSTKCPPGEAFQVGVESRAYLAGLGLNLTADLQTKTKTTLEFFGSELSTAGNGNAGLPSKGRPTEHESSDPQQSEGQEHRT